MDPKIAVLATGAIGGPLGVWVTTIIKMLVSVRGDVVRKREKVRFRLRKGVLSPLNN